MGGASFQINWTAIDKHMTENEAVKAELKLYAEEAAGMWREIAPVGQRDHKLKSGYWDRAGQYKAAVEVSEGETVHAGHLVPYARVENTDFKKFWLEYGTKKDEHGRGGIRPQHVMTQVRTAMSLQPGVSRI